MNEKLALSQAAINYCLRQLAIRAGLEPTLAEGNGFENIGLPVYYRSPDKDEEIKPAIYVIPCDQKDWRELINLPNNSLNFLSPEKCFPDNQPFPALKSVPIVLWGKGNKQKSRPFVKLEPDGKLIFNADIILSTFFFLSRWEEIQSPNVDVHHRFLGKESFAFRQGIHDRPIVDEYALILKTWLMHMFPRWTPKNNKFSIRITYDVDRLYQFHDLKSASLTIADTLLRQQKLLPAADAVKLGINQLSKNPRIVGVNSLVGLSKQSKHLNSDFYFIMGEDGLPNCGYNYQEPTLRWLIKSLKGKGVAIGLQGTPDASTDGIRLAIEKQRIEDILDYSVDTCRFHYLNFEVPKTWRLMEQLGFKYSFNMAFADLAGFRSGTCHPYHPFDLENDREMNIIEIPLIVMDVTLIHYQKLSPQEGKQHILRLARRCQQVGGLFTLLWHNTSLRANNLLWGKVFPDIITSLDNMIKRLTKFYIG